jgi:hypothetical protein
MKMTRILKGLIVAAVMAGTLLMVPSAAHAAVFVGVGIAPPAIPVYDQPIAPGDGYLWTPGYWAYGDEPSGRPATGDGAAAATSGTPATGVATSATTAASTTALATSE